MARNREFCPNEALDKAMRVFWAKGYAGASIEDLVSATGVSRYGLYGEFGGKSGLFLAALEHYRATVIRPLLDIIEPPEASLGAVHALFATLLEFMRKPGARLGCLIFNSMYDMDQYDEATAETIIDSRERLRSGLRRMLDNAVQKGELPPEFNVIREADFLFGVMHALPMMARSGGDASTIENMVAVAMSTLEPAPAPNPE
jgi:TetR/AcrR family transcriptional repressor of nem operon